jgi:hypothetical protein
MFFASLIGLLLYSIWSRLWLSIKLTSIADVVASVTLNYQLIQNSLEFENFKN